MKNYRILLVEDDEYYGRKLAIYLEEHEDSPFEVSLIDGGEFRNSVLKNFLKTDRNIRSAETKTDRNSQPGEVRPGIIQPGEVRPGKIQPGISQPGEVQPGKIRPMEIRSEEIKSGRQYDRSKYNRLKHDSSKTVNDMVSNDARSCIPHGRWDMILISGEYAVALPEESVENFVFLSEGVEIFSGELPCIYKYQSAERIYMELMRLYVETGRRLHRGGIDRETETIAALCFRQDEKTKKRIRKRLSEMSSERKLLYVNLEQIAFPDMEVMDNDMGSAGEGFSELIYHVKLGSDDIGIRAYSMIHHGVYDYILPPDVINEIYDLTPEDWDRLLSELGSSSDYVSLILDFGCSLPPEAVIDRCEKLLVFTTGSEWENAYTDALGKLLFKTAGTGAEEKITMEKL